MDTPPSASAKKPRALFLSPEAPYPAIGGGALRSASLLEYLSRHFSVHAIVFRQPGDNDPAPAVPPGRVETLSLVDLPFHSRRPAARVFRNTVRALLNRPPLFDRFSGFASAIEALVAGQQYEVAIIEHFWCAPYVEQLRPRSKRVLLDLHNIESVWHDRLAVTERGIHSLAFGRFANKLRDLERLWLPQFDSLLVTSAQDAETARAIAPGASVTIYPNALPEIAAPPKVEQEAIAFSGNLEYAPNAGAVQFFHREIWPLLGERWPQLQWRIIGKNPEAIAGEVRCDPRVRFTGPVEDAVACLASAKVAIVPMLAGSGTRVKILEAWAAATPVVSTTLGAEGLDCRHREHLLLADEPRQFADAVATLLASPEERARIGAAGRRLFEERYTWPAAWRSLAPVFQGFSTG